MGTYVELHVDVIIVKGVGTNVASFRWWCANVKPMQVITYEGSERLRPHATPQPDPRMGPGRPAAMDDAAKQSAPCPAAMDAAAKQGQTTLQASGHEGGMAAPRHPEAE